MKSLFEFLLEALIEKNDLLHPKGGVENIKEALGIISDMHNFLKLIGGTMSPKLTKDMYSLNNKQDMTLVYNAFKSCTQLPNLKHIDSKKLYKWNIENVDKFRAFLNENASLLLDPSGKYKWTGITKILQFNPTKLEKEHEEWRKSADYVEGHQWNKDDYDPSTEERSLIIYDRRDNDNPATIIEFPFKGKRGKSTDHQVNMLRVEWCRMCGYKTSEKYYDAYPKLANNFYKNGPAPYEEMFDNSDLD